MKTLVIEKTTVGSSECEVIILHDLKNVRSSFVYTNEPKYQDWVKNQADVYRINGYKIDNQTNIAIKQ
jgi:hypothetical protein